MTFGGEVKNELCRAGLSRKCCAQAEAYGVLLYCNTFCGGEIRIVTEHEAFAQRLPALFRKAFRLSFDRLPEGEGKRVFSIQAPDKLRLIHQTYGVDPEGLARTLTSRPWRSPAAARPSSGARSCPAAR